MIRKTSATDKSNQTFFEIALQKDHFSECSHEFLKKEN